MARLGKYTHIFIDGYALSGHLTAVTPEAVWDEIEASGYTHDHRYLAGQQDGTITVDGYFEETAATHEALQTIANGTAKYVTIALGNNATPTVGDPACSMKAQQMNYTVTPAKDGIIAVNAVFKSMGNGIEWGTLLFNSNITADGNGATVDQAAQSTAGAVAYFHLTGLSAGDVIDTLAVHDSNDNFSVDNNAVVSSTLNGSAIGAERVAVTGTVERYVRLSATVTGSGVSFPVAVNFIRL
jgi:hypothetical protein